MLHFACMEQHMQVAKLLLEQMTRDAILSLNQVSIGCQVSIGRDFYFRADVPAICSLGLCSTVD